MSELALRLIEENKKTRATFLDLGNCSLTEVPEELGELVWLECLLLSGHWWSESFDTAWEYKRYTPRHTRNSGNQNNIKYLPKSFSNLINLKFLLLPDNPLSDLSVLANMTNLRLIDCSSTLLTDLSPFLSFIH